MANTKLSLLPTNSSPATTDSIVMIQSPSVSPQDMQVTIAALFSLVISKTTDANGWTVYNYGTFKKFVKSFTDYPTAGSLAANTTSGALIASGTALPVGISNMSQLSALTHTFALANNSPAFIMGLETGGPTLYNSSLTTLPTFYLRNITESSSTSVQNVVTTIELTT